MTKYTFDDITVGKEGLLKGPFGSDLKRSLYVPKSKDTYKVYVQENILRENNDAGTHYISKEYYEKKMSRYAVKEGDFIVTCDGTLGEIFQLKNIKEKGIISSSLLRITLNNNIVDDNYFYYLWKAIIRKQLITQGNNSVLKHLPGIEVIRKHKIELPDLKTQQKVGQILKLIDTKISNNNAISSQLESLAKTIYDYWFLQFEFPNEDGKPYKSSGGKIVWNEELKRETPEGWNVTNVGNITTCLDSKRVPLSSKDRENMKGPYPYYGARSEMDSVNEYLFDGDYVLLAEDGSVMDDNGFPILQRTSGKVWVNNHAHVLQPKKPYGCKLLMFILKNIPVSMIKTGSIQMKVNQENLNAFKVLSIPENLIEKANSILNPIDAKIIMLKQENQKIASLRDFLLPMLINGQVTFKD